MFKHKIYLFYVMHHCMGNYYLQRLTLTLAMIRAENFYVVRTPLLPVNIITTLDHITNATLAAVIKEIFRDEYLQEAIYIASPELYQELQKWLQDTSANKKENDKLASALYRYLLRMSTRCTPYGLFAGCATGAPADHSAIRLNNKTEHKKHCRLDMNYVAELAAAITAVPDIATQLRFYPNNSLYATGKQYRYAAYTVKNKIRHYYLTAVNQSPYLDKILHTAAGGATLTDIRNSIVSEADEISEAEAGEFITELLENQLLVSELTPTVTGEEFFGHLHHRLKALSYTAEFTTPIARIQSMLQDQQTGIAKYTATHALVKSMLTETSSKDLVQTDLFLSASSNTLSHTVINELSATVAQLWKLAATNKNGDLQSFCEAFQQRYEEQEVPLGIALDTEAGIGYGSHRNSNTDHTPLIDDIQAAPRTQPTAQPRSKMQEFQLQQLHQCLRDGKKVITITKEQLDTLSDKEVPALPASMYLMGSLLSSSAGAVDNGDYLFDMTGCSGPSAANLLGRFCHGDEKLAAKVKASLAEEEAADPEKIYAEIIHLPESRTGNILMRPRLREYEIVYLANSLTPEAFQIHLSDLMVSVQRGKVILRSKRLNKIIVPRLSTAHNYRNGLPVYKFLCDLQNQDFHSGIAWQWQLPGEVSFFPRVQYGHVILSKSSWVLHKKTYPALAGATAAEYMNIFREIKTQLELPRYVVITEGDNELPADLDNEVAVHLLVTQLLKKEQITLQEFLPTPDNCWIDGPDGKHTNEFIIPLRYISPEKNKKQTITTAITETPTRKFVTGSEWLYVKLYAGTRSAENILTEVILPLTQALIRDNIIDKWFFIRYSDPENHLRVRFHHGEHKDFWKVVLERLYSAMASSTDVPYRLQTDTYEREIERYGAHTMIFSEDLFHYDSESILQILDLLEGEEGENYRWLLALRGVDTLLNDFGYTLPEKFSLLKILQKNFHEEFGGGKPLLVQLNDKYREEMRKISSILDPSQDIANGIEEATALFAIRSRKIKQHLTNANIGQRDDLLGSYIHMFLNRMLLSNQRKHELVMYHFLSRYYESLMAIAKKQLTTVV
jgi:lantibiotic biosynthesis protein